MEGQAEAGCVGVQSAPKWGAHSLATRALGAAFRTGTRLRGASCGRARAICGRSRGHTSPEFRSQRSSAMLAMRAVLAAVTLATAANAELIANFRPPAIPLLTTDPYMQTWMMGDSITDDIVRHWDQTPKEIMGMVRVDGKSHRFLSSSSS